MAREPGRVRRSREWLVWTIAVLALATTAVEVAGSSAGTVSRVLVLVAATAFIGSGAVLVSHRPDNPVSWLLALPPLYFAGDGVGDVGVAVLEGSAEAWVRWAEQSLFAPTMFTVAALLPVLFPTGRPPTPRWRWVVGVGALGAAGLAVGNAIAPDLLSEVESGLANPAAVAPEGVATAVLTGGLVCFVVAFLGGVASLVVRAHRATGVERQQIRWVARAGVGALLGWVLAGTLESRDVRFSGELFVLGLALLPVAVAVAVLRYRLYDLDRLVSRTLAWAGVSGILAVAYVAVVLAAQGLLGTRELPDAVVAGSTLLAAATVRPLHSRVQRLVDRRFNRSRVGAAAAVDGFGQRLRDEVDLDSIAHELRGVVATTLAPRVVTVWTPSDAVRGQ